MGQVLDAEHRAFARRVVVKVVREDARVPQGDDRLRLEIGLKVAGLALVATFATMIPVFVAMRR